MKKRINVIAIMTLLLLLALGGCGAGEAEADTAGGEALSGKTSQAADIWTSKEATEGAEPDVEARTPDGAGGETGKKEGKNLEELFGIKGVYWQELADNGEAIDPEDKWDFLELFGFGDSIPFYVHTEEDGYALMELYYDEEREIGCVILDGENTGNYSYGSAFNSCHEVSWHYPDPFSVLSIYGTTGEEAVTDYRENYEYDREGRLVHFQSTGTPLESPLGEADNNEDWYDQYIIDVAFSYDDQGKLTKKIYNHSSAYYMPFGTWFSWQVSHYDERERLVHTASYVTHGSVEGYYIYQGDSDVPAYFLELDHGWDVTFYRFDTWYY